MTERRDQFRHRVFRSGRILFGKAVVRCIVRNVSERGARLDLPTYGIPAAFEVAIADEPPRPCKVKWADPAHLGVEYE